MITRNVILKERSDEGSPEHLGPVARKVFRFAQNDFTVFTKKKQLCDLSASAVKFRFRIERLRTCSVP